MPHRQINCTFTAAGDYSEFYGRTTEKQQQPVTLLLKLLVRVNKRLEGGKTIHLTDTHLSSIKCRQFELKREREEFKKTKEEEGGGEKTNRSFCCCCCWQRAAAQEKGRTRTSVSERPPLSPSSSTRTPAPPAASSWPSSPSSAASGWKLEEEDSSCCSYHVTHWQIAIFLTAPLCSNIAFEAHLQRTCQMPPSSSSSSNLCSVVQR